MKTKIIPFDLETSKKIQAGEIEGKILNNLKNEVRIVCFDREDDKAPIIALFKEDGGEGVMYVKNDGRAVNCRDILVLEVPDNEPQFKPFDRVLVRRDEDDNGEPDTWVISFFMNESVAGYRVLNGEWFDECILYEGNENLLGTTDKPKEN